MSLYFCENLVIQIWETSVGNWVKIHTKNEQLQRCAPAAAHVILGIWSGNTIQNDSELMKSRWETSLSAFQVDKYEYIWGELRE